MGVNAAHLPDSRFFETLPPLSLGDLAKLTGARLIGGSEGTRIARAATLDRAGVDAVAFAVDVRRSAGLANTKAGACFAAAEATGGACCPILASATPQAAWAIAAERLHAPRRHPAGSSAIHPDAELEEGVEIATGAAVGPGARIGRGTYIAPLAVIGPGVTLGRNSYVGAGAHVGFALIGDRVRIYAGAVIGEAGFGAAIGPQGVVDVPQLGRVILQDGVTVGANSCIDRGAFDDTVIGENTKIDNLVQIAHNVTIGRNCVLAAHTGISGSVVIGDNCMFGGRAGVADHITIGAGARIAASAGVIRDVPPGERWGGTPARTARQWMREAAWVSAAAARKGRDKS